jgi:Tfp pilus assembly protein PilX
MLLVLTILGVAATTASQLELKMASNAQDKQRSFVAAENARLAAEILAMNLGDSLRNPSNLFTCTGTNGLFANSSDPQTSGCGGLVSDPANHDWTNNSMSVTGSTDRYIVEFLGQQNVVLPNDANRGIAGSETLVPARVFRLTVRGTGVDGGTTFLQAIYTRI